MDVGRLALRRHKEEAVLAHVVRFPLPYKSIPMMATGIDVITPLRLITIRRSTLLLPKENFRRHIAESPVGKIIITFHDMP